jgi:hypothetical protein
MISLGGLVSQKAFGKFEMGKVISNPFANAFIKEGDGEDHEVSMGQNQLDTIIKMATELKSKMGEDEKEIPAWIQDHISKAENYISQAAGNYHEYGDSNENINEAPKKLKHTISKKEWSKIPKYNKHIGMDGIHYIMKYDDKLGTYLQGVEIVDESVNEASPCWKGYKQVGMKDKGGRQVPNCVPNESVVNEAPNTGERIQNLNNRIKALRDKLSATKSPEQKKLFQDRLKNALQTLSNIKKDYSIKKESVNEIALNEGFADSIKKIRNLAIKIASTKYDRAKSHLNIDKIADADDFKGTDAMNKATAALLQQKDLDEDLKSAINKIAVKLGAGSTMMGIITALVSLSGWVQYLDASFTKWYYTEIQKLAEPEVMRVMQDMGKAGQAEGSIYGKFGMYAFFIFFTIAVISLVAAKMTRDNKNEYVDKKGVEHVAAALPQTEEEPIKECKTC